MAAMTHRPPLWKFTDHGANAQNLKPKCHHNIEFSTRTGEANARYWNLFVQHSSFSFRNPWKYSWLKSTYTSEGRSMDLIKKTQKKVWVKVLQFDQFVFGCCGRRLWYNWTKGSNQSPRSCMLNKGLSFFVPQRRAPLFNIQQTAAPTTKTNTGLPHISNP